MKHIHTYKKLSLALSTALILTACEVGDGTTAFEPTGLDRITEYAQNGGTLPTLQDYLDAGGTGIDSEEKLAEINQVVEGLVSEDVDTAQEVQALADALGVVVDTTAPVITITGGNTATVLQNATYTDAGATATDDVDGSVNVTTTGTVDTSTLGDYTITYTATDAAGNSATATRTVTVEAFTIIHNGTTYGTVTSPYTGKVWLDRNLGAAQVCASSTDTACYGDYYQWGRNFDGHQDSTSATTSTQATDVNSAGSSFITSSNTYSYDWAKSADSSGSQRTVNWSATDGTSVCPVGFRVPTLTELKAETLDNGVTNSATAFSNFLKLPTAGYRFHSSGSLVAQGSWGDVWTSSVNGSVSHYVGFDSSDANVYYNNRAYGFTVRCLRD